MSISEDHAFFAWSIPKAEFSTAAIGTAVRRNLKACIADVIAKIAAEVGPHASELTTRNRRAVCESCLNDIRLTTLTFQVFIQSQHLLDWTSKAL